MQYINLLATCEYKQHTDTHTDRNIDAGCRRLVISSFPGQMLLVASTPVCDALLPIHKDEMFQARICKIIREHKIRISCIVQAMQTETMRMHTASGTVVSSQKEISSQQLPSRTHIRATCR